MPMNLAFLGSVGDGDRELKNSHDPFEFLSVMIASWTPPPVVAEGDASSSRPVSKGARPPTPKSPMKPKSPMEEMLADPSAEALESVKILLCPVCVDCWVNV